MGKIVVDGTVMLAVLGLCCACIEVIITKSYMLRQANTLAVLTSNPPIEASHPKARGTR